MTFYVVYSQAVHWYRSHTTLISRITEREVSRAASLNVLWFCCAAARCSAPCDPRHPVFTTDAAHTAPGGLLFDIRAGLSHPLVVVFRKARPSALCRCSEGIRTVWPEENNIRRKLVGGDF